MLDCAKNMPRCSARIRNETLPQENVYGTETGGPGLAYGLDGISDWAPSQVFLNVMKSSRSWIGHLEGRWGGMEYEEMDASGILDQNGYLTEMPDGVASVETFILTEMPVEATYTEGRYRLTYEGEGEIHVGGTAHNVTYGDGEVWFDYTPNGEGIVGVGLGNAQQHQQTGTDLAGGLAFHDDLGLAHSLNTGTHMHSLRLNAE